jgi:hypothetical protein
VQSSPSAFRPCGAHVLEICTTAWRSCASELQKVRVSKLVTLVVVGITTRAFVPNAAVKMLADGYILFMNNQLMVSHDQILHRKNLSPIRFFCLFFCILIFLLILLLLQSALCENWGHSLQHQRESLLHAGAHHQCSRCWRRAASLREGNQHGVVLNEQELGTELGVQRQ